MAKISTIFNSLFRLVKRKSQSKSHLQSTNQQGSSNQESSTLYLNIIKSFNKKIKREKSINTKNIIKLI